MPGFGDKAHVRQVVLAGYSVTALRVSHVAQVIGFNVKADSRTDTHRNLRTKAVAERFGDLSSDEFKALIGVFRQCGYFLKFFNTHAYRRLDCHRNSLLI